MNKKLFLLLIVLMSLSLIGIIFVQGYWIKRTVEDKEEQFSYNAKQILISVSKKLQNQEIENFWFEFADKDSTSSALDEDLINNYFKTDDAANVDTDGVLPGGSIEEDNKVSSDFLAYAQDSAQVSKLINRRVEDIFNDENVKPDQATSEERLNRMMRMRDVEKDLLRSYISEFTSRIPIHKRLSKSRIEDLIRNELKNYNLNSEFEFGVYNNSLATKVHTDNFDIDEPATYSVPLFVSNAGESNYQLLVNFTGKKKVVLSSVTLMAVLSIIFTLIIVIAYSSALSQLIKQRQISQIKTDFINNMTHEFKTPIATINLALDAIKNPKIIDDKEKVQRYLQMIKDENKRMHAQVENVLRISKLEKKELDINKEPHNVHDIIEDAVEHISLIVEDREGEVTTDFEATRTTALLNDSHFTNVIVNILDNAIKYSVEKPIISIHTENLRDFILIKIKDNGIGMSKVAQKKAFDKFFREHTGDVHNVKGHGLGLSYVKQIIDDHNGYISVESEKGKGSIFTIKMPIIN